MAWLSLLSIYFPLHSHEHNFSDFFICLLIIPFFFSPIFLTFCFVDYVKGEKNIVIRHDMTMSIDSVDIIKRRKGLLPGQSLIFSCDFWSEIHGRKFGVDLCKQTFFSQLFFICFTFSITKNRLTCQRREFFLWVVLFWRKVNRKKVASCWEVG